MAHASHISVVFTGRELVFLGTLCRNLFAFITEEEQSAQRDLGTKLLHSGHLADETPVQLARDEVFMLNKLARLNYSFITRSEKQARQALLKKLAAAHEAVTKGPWGSPHRSQPRRSKGPPRSRERS
jgi:hypothetical protein